jgi:hypothetical protein
VEKTVRKKEALHPWSLISVSNMFVVVITISRRKFSYCIQTRNYFPFLHITNIRFPISLSGMHPTSAFRTVFQRWLATPDCWLVVSLRPEGPATGQLDQGFPWFSLVPERMLSWYPNSTLHCMLLMQPSKY